ncbi:hypothetical protein NDU88_005497 [Pleurodeles waltl]|uniref:Uncharacterized protein n=1 Tax=Pleurodeles waltl TaxID=8319 RepID=A0AAV7SLU0_PLEWA|nr:hypothetical protein NDU88_005497 [Pleurodeles waltl]
MVACTGRVLIKLVSGMSMCVEQPRKPESAVPTTACTTSSLYGCVCRVPLSSECTLGLLGSDAPKRQSRLTSVWTTLVVPAKFSGSVTWATLLLVSYSEAGVLSHGTSQGCDALCPAREASLLPGVTLDTSGLTAASRWVTAWYTHLSLLHKEPSWTPVTALPSVAPWRLLRATRGSLYLSFGLFLGSVSCFHCMPGTPPRLTSVWAPPVSQRSPLVRSVGLLSARLLLCAEGEVLSHGTSQGCDALCQAL